MADARLMRTKIIGESGATPDFATTGSRVVFDGWLKADPDARGDDVELPKVTAGEPLKLVDVVGTQKFTQPPSRYSEAGLVKALEERGIGRPSTYASIISTLGDRGYVEKDGRALKPTDTGEVVSQFLEDNFTSYISDTFTAEMENELDEIASGERDYVTTLSDFYGPFSKDVKSKESMEKQTTFGEADPRHKCPTCGSPMLVKLGRGGKFLSCSTYPDCQGALSIDGVEINAEKAIGNHPDTAEPIYVKTGRFGPYVQLGEKVKGSRNKPRMASIPKDTDPTTVSVEQALKYLSVPRTLGNHPETGSPVVANNGRFGPYISHSGEFRSIKPPDDVYTIDMPRGLELLAQEKKSRFRKKE
jgi:DNA topoisomerase-1